MASLKEEAIAYEPKQTLNIAELDKVPIDLEIHEGTGKDKEGVEFTYKYVSLNDKEYRVPNPVFEEIQTILKLRPDVKNIKVNRTGTGKTSRYKVEIRE